MKILLKKCHFANVTVPSTFAPHALNFQAKMNDLNRENKLFTESFVVELFCLLLCVNANMKHDGKLLSE